jgi:SHS2 domain-containing protein
MGRWEEVEHTADLALHVWATDLADLFVTAAQGMAALITDPDTVTPERVYSVALTAPDLEGLLVDWLNELLYLGEREGLVFTRFEGLTVTPPHLEALAWGGVPSERHTYIKAATFHNLAVRATPAGYETEIVLDT